jgi:hypothetical protein
LRNPIVDQKLGDCALVGGLDCSLHTDDALLARGEKRIDLID